jgi:hypothetical protein
MQTHPNRKDPTLLSLFLAALMLLIALTPWVRRQSRVPWEWEWGLMLIPVTLAVCLLRPRRWEGWLAILFSVASFVRGLPGLGHPWAGGLTVLKWTLEESFNDLCPALGLVVFILVLLVTATLAVKASDHEATWPIAAARAYIALMASLALWYPLDYFGAGNIRPHALNLPLFRTALALLPVVIFTLLLWRRPPGMFLWLGVIMASVALLGVSVFELEHLKLADVALLSLAAIAGPAWAYRDWRRSRLVTYARGFEVVIPT